MPLAKESSTVEWQNEHWIPIARMVPFWSKVPVTPATVPLMLTAVLVVVVDVSRSSVAVDPFTVTPISTWSLLCIVPIGIEALVPGPEKLRTTAMGGTLTSVKLPSAPTVAKMLVPSTVTVTPTTVSACWAVNARLALCTTVDPPDNVPAIVAPEVDDDGGGASVTVGDAALVGARGEPWLPHATDAAREATIARILRDNVVTRIPKELISGLEKVAANLGQQCSCRELGYGQFLVSMGFGRRSTEFEIASTHDCEGTASRLSVARSDA